MTGWRIALWAALMLAALGFLWLVRGELPPFVAAFIVAALLEPVVGRLRQRGVSRGWAVITVVSGFVMVLVAGVALFAPTVAHQVSTLSAKAQDLTRLVNQASPDDDFFVRWNPVVHVNESSMSYQIDGLLDKYGGYLEKVDIPATRRGLIDKYVVPRRPEIAKFVENFFSSLLGVFTNLLVLVKFVILTLVLIPMLLMDMETMRRRGPRWIPPAIRASALRMMSEIGDVFVRYLRGISLVLLLFTVCQITMLLIMGVPYAILLGLLLGTLYLIPYIGNVVSAVVVFSVVGFSNVNSNFFLHFSSAWWYAALVLLIYLSIGAFFDHVVYPNLVGASVGLGPVISVFVILSGGALFGLTGMVIAFPLAGSAKVILDRLLKVTSSSSEHLHLPSIPRRHRERMT